MDVHLTVGWERRIYRDVRKYKPLSTSCVPLAQIMWPSFSLSLFYFLCNLLYWLLPIPLPFLPEGFCLWVFMHLIVCSLLQATSLCGSYSDSPKRKFCLSWQFANEKILGGQSSQIRPLRTNWLLSCLFHKWLPMAVNSCSSLLQQRLQVNGYRAQQWHGTWEMTVDLFFQTWAIVICTQSFMYFFSVHSLSIIGIIHIFGIMVRHFLLKKSNFTPSKT